MNNRRNLRAAGTVLAAVGLVAAMATACGSSDTSSAAGGSTIVVGTIGSYSGSQSGSLAGAKTTIQMWADYVNDHGGIRGHKVKLSVKDDGGNASTAITAVKQLAGEHAVAIVGEQSQVDPAWAPAAQQAGIPVVGGLSIDMPFLTNPDFFAAGTNIVALSYGMVSQAKKNGPKLAMLYCAEAPQCQQVKSLYAALAPALGVQIVYTGAISATAPDYTAACQAIKQSGADSYEIGDASPVVLRVAQQCAQQGVTAKNVTEDGTVTAAWASAPAMQGVLSAEADFPFIDSSVPNSKAFQDALAHYAPNLGDQNGPTASYSWAAGLLFQKAVESAPAGPVTADTVKNGLYSLKGETLGGIVPPLTFTRGNSGAAQVNCYFTMGIDGGKFTEPNGLKTECAPGELVSAVVAKLAQ